MTETEVQEMTETVLQKSSAQTKAGLTCDAMIAMVERNGHMTEKQLDTVGMLLTVLFVDGDPNDKAHVEAASKKATAFLTGFDDGVEGFKTMLAALRDLCEAEGSRLRAEAKANGGA